MTTAQLLARQTAQLDRLRASGYFVSEIKDVNAILAWKPGENRTCAMLFKGRAAKPLFNYSFKTQEKAESYLADVLKNLKARAVDTKARRAAKVDAKANWTVGDVVSYSWGYDQTNVDFFQVTRVSASSVWIREITQNSSDQGQAAGGKCAPRRFEFVEGSKEIRKRGTDYLSMPHGVGRKWEGRALYTSSTH